MPNACLLLPAHVGQEFPCNTCEELRTARAGDGGFQALDLVLEAVALLAQRLELGADACGGGLDFQLRLQLGHHQHRAPAQRLLAAQDVAVDVVPHVQHLHACMLRVSRGTLIVCGAPQGPGTVGS